MRVQYYDTQQVPPPPPPPLSRMSLQSSESRSAVLDYNKLCIIYISAKYFTADLHYVSYFVS